MASKKTWIWAIIAIVVILIAFNLIHINLQLFTTTPVCGNFVCESGETCTSCPVDCGACNCEEGAVEYANCGEGWVPNKWAIMQCINRSWVVVSNVNPCYCNDNTYCTSNYVCRNNICTPNIPLKPCANTTDCIIRGFYCNELHQCARCPSFYSTFSIYDCQFSNFTCISANDCYSLSNDYCSKWVCSQGTCLNQGGERFDRCCSLTTDCEANQTCTNHYCTDIVVPTPTPTSPLNIGITILIIGGIGVGGYFLWKKYK